VLQLDGNGHYLLVASVLDDDSNILLLGKLNRGLHVVRSRHVDHITGIVPQLAGLRLRRERYVRVFLKILM
jgi:hypothetical protein